MYLILLSTFFFQLKDAQSFENSVPLKAEIMLTHSEMDFFANDLRLINSRCLVFISYTNDSIHLLPFTNMKIKTLVEKGPAPWEINGEIINAFVLNDEVIFSDFSGTLKSVNIEGKYRKLSDMPWDTRGCISIDRHIVCVNNGLSDWQADVGIPQTNLVIYGINKDRSWNKLGGVYDADVTGLESYDSMFAFNTHIFPTKDNSYFYRIPLVNYPEIQIMDLNGVVRNKFPVPHPNSKYLAKTTERRLDQFNKEVRIKVIVDATVDKDGFLYVVIGNLFDAQFNKKVIIKMDDQGKIHKTYRSDVPIREIEMSDKENEFFIIDQDDNFYRLAAPKTK